MTPARSVAALVSDGGPLRLLQPSRALCRLKTVERDALIRGHR